MKKHFVTFYSPGSFVAETTTKPIKSWNIETAVEMARAITERYGAKPYGFTFSTRERGPSDLDSRETKRSSFYYLGGKIETVEEVRARGNPKEEILLRNMEINGYARVIVNDNSWRWTQPFGDADILLDVKL